MAKITRPRLLVGIAATATVAATIVLLAGDDDSPLGGPSVAEAALTPFSSCDELYDYALAHPWALNYPISVMAMEAGGPVAIAADAAIAGAGPAPAQQSEARAEAADPAAVTNVQEAGIDEPDIVKAAGDVIYAVSGGRLYAVSAGPSPEVLSSIELSLPSSGDLYTLDRQLLIGEGRVLVITSFEGGAFGRSETLLTEVSVTDPDAIQVVRSQRLEGRFISGRADGGTARIVVGARLELDPAVAGEPAPTEPAPLPDEPVEDPAEPAPAPDSPDSGGGAGSAPSTGSTGSTGSAEPVPEPADGDSADGATEPGFTGDGDAPVTDVAEDPAVARAIAEPVPPDGGRGGGIVMPTPEPGPVAPYPPGPHPDWMPATVITDELTGEVSRDVLVGCDQVAFPPTFAGLELLTVLTVDLSQGLPAVDSDAVVASGDTVYGSDEGLYVATTEWAEPQPVGTVEPVDPDAPVSSEIAVGEPAPTIEPDTLIHRFATSEPGVTAYAASGAVPGRLLSQFSMSSYDGHLRVATTTGSAWASGAQESESHVWVLAQEGDALEVVGSIGGLGRGEEIRAVRFLGNRGYVVTFEQTDPLYVLDLSNPEHPWLGGELKIPGYSAYLHPAGDGRLIGVGQDATAQGSTLGAQVSLFDVSDAANPQRLDYISLGAGTTTPVEWDHHAFSFDPETGQVVVPVENWGWEDGASRSWGAVIAIAGDELERRESITNAAVGGPIERTIRLDDETYTLSKGGIIARNPETLVPGTKGAARFDGNPVIID